ncbi:hypothetical protein ACFLSK_01135, partial [Chloroflexota bacterium]
HCRRLVVGSSCSPPAYIVARSCGFVRGTQGYLGEVWGGGVGQSQDRLPDRTISSCGQSIAYNWSGSIDNKGNAY